MLSHDAPHQPIRRAGNWSDRRPWPVVSITAVFGYACSSIVKVGTYPPFFGDLALSLQLGPGLPSFQDAVVLFGIDIERLFLKHFSPWQGDTLHCGNSATSWHHLIDGETQTGTQCLEPWAYERKTDTNKKLQCSWLHQCQWSQSLCSYSLPLDRFHT